MSTEFFNDQWRIPSNENQNKVSNYSMDFNGSSDKIEVQDASNEFGFSNNSFSLSAWVFIDSNTTQNGLIAKRNIGTAAANKMWYFEINTSSQLRFLWYNTVGGSSNASSTDTIPLNTWTHVVVTSDGTGANGLNFYINGSVDSGGSKTGPSSASSIQQTGTQLWVGARGGNSSAQYTSGKIDQVAVFDYELSASQVSTLYGGGTAVTNPMSLSPKPIAYYQLGDQSVSTGPTSDYLVPNNSLSGYDFKFVKNNSSYTSGDSINIPGINKALAGATSMSMTFWVYLTPAVYNNGMVFRMDAGLGFIQVRFIRYGNSRGPVWLFSMNDGTNSSGPSGSTSNAPRPNFYNYDFLATPTSGSNIWWNITCTWDGSNVKVYRNGATQSSRWGTYTGIIPSNANATAFLGANAPGSSTGLFMDGRISNVAFWRNYSLTQSEAQEVYNNGAPLDLNNFSGSAPAAWYKLNASEIFNSTSTEWSVDNNAYPSVYQSSLDFNGSSNYIDCGDSDTFSFGNGTTDSPFSISAWINMTSNASVFRIVNKYDTNYEYQFDVLSGVLRFYVLNDPFTGYRGITGSTLNTGQWYHVVATYSGVGGSAAQNGMELYVNGQNVISSASTFGSYTAMSNTTAPVYIGRVATTYSNGEISNASIFNTELTGTQVTTLYNNGTPETSISHSPVSWWKLNNTTTGLIDNGSASNNGTNNGATEYAGFVNALGGESVGMDSSNLVVSDLQQTSGYSPYALNFDAINDALTIQNSSTFNLGTAFTISGWFNFGSNKYQGLISFDATNGGSPRGWFLFQISSSNNIRLFDGANIFTLKTSYTTTNQWDSFIITYDGTDLVFYINGNQESTQAVSIDLQTNGNDAQIGNNQFASGRFFDGKISNIAFWNVGLTSTQVTEVFNEGRPSDLHNFSGTAPVSWWQLGSNSSYNSGAWTCLDEIGTNNAVSAGNMTNDAITDGPGYSASGLGTSSIDIKGDAPYSTANGLSENMDVLDRTTDIPS